MRSIQNFSTNTMSYYDDISSNILIKVYDENDQSSGYSVNVMRAIPLSIDDVDLSWADTDKLMEYSVTFSYEQLQIQNISTPQNDDQLSPTMN